MVAGGICCTVTKMKNGLDKELERETLVISHDGSYMSDKSKVMAGAGLIVHYTAFGKYVRCGLVETFDNDSSYRGEVLGGILSQLVLKAATGSTHVRTVYLLYTVAAKGFCVMGTMRT